MADLVIYTKPKGANVTIVLQDGRTYIGMHKEYMGRDDAKIASIPDTYVGAAILQVKCYGYQTFSESGELGVSANGRDASFTLHDGEQEIETVTLKKIDEGPVPELLR